MLFRRFRGTKKPTKDPKETTQGTVNADPIGNIFYSAHLPDQIKKIKFFKDLRTVAFTFLEMKDDYLKVFYRDNKFQLEDFVIRCDTKIEQMSKSDVGIKNIGELISLRDKIISFHGSNNLSEIKNLFREIAQQDYDASDPRSVEIANMNRDEQCDNRDYLGFLDENNNFNIDAIDSRINDIESFIKETKDKITGIDSCIKDIESSIKEIKDKIRKGEITVIEGEKDIKEKEAEIPKLDKMKKFMETNIKRKEGVVPKLNKMKELMKNYNNQNSKQSIDVNNNSSSQRLVSANDSSNGPSNDQNNNTL